MIAAKTSAADTRTGRRAFPRRVMANQPPYFQPAAILAHPLRGRRAHAHPELGVCDLRSMRLSPAGVTFRPSSCRHSATAQSARSRSFPFDCAIARRSRAVACKVVLFPSGASHVRLPLTFSLMADLVSAIADHAVENRTTIVLRVRLPFVSQNDELTRKRQCLQNIVVAPFSHRPPTTTAECIGGRRTIQDYLICKPCAASAKTARYVGKAGRRTSRNTL